MDENWLPCRGQVNGSFCITTYVRKQIKYVRVSRSIIIKSLNKITQNKNHAICATCIIYVSQQGLELQYEPRIVPIGQQLIKSERHGLVACMRRRWLFLSIVIIIPFYFSLNVRYIRIYLLWFKFCVNCGLTSLEIETKLNGTWRS